MKLVVKNVSGDDRGMVKRSLKKVIRPRPAVDVARNGAVKTDTLVLVTVVNGPPDKLGRENLEKKIDVVLSQCGYRFCNVSHQS